jgi:hypothetical protein
MERTIIDLDREDAGRRTRSNRASIPNCARFMDAWRRNATRRLCWLVPIFAALLGAAPHLAFSVAVGEIAYFKSAFDEDTYFLIRHEIGLYRFLSGRLIDLFLQATGPATDVTMILPDILFPTFAALGALFFARRVAAGAPLRILVAILLLFGPDLFSLANSTIWRWDLLGAARSAIGPLGTRIVPDASSSFLNLYRSSEPQLSYGFLFVTWALLADIVRGGGAGRPLRVFGLAACMTALSLGYSLIYLPALASLGATALVVATQRRIATAVTLVAVAALSLGLFAFASITSGTGNALVFASRLPIATPAVIVSALLTPLVAIAAWRSNGDRGTLLLALAMLAMPAVLCNQQIVTGLMVSARDWERNINYPLLVAGVALAISATKASRSLAEARVWSPVAFATVAAIVGILLVAQVRAYDIWLRSNLRSVAIVRALGAAEESSADARLVLDDVGLAPLVAVRRPKSLFVLDFTDVFRTAVPAMAADGARPASPHEAKLFEYFWRTGRAPDEVASLLGTEARARAGFYLGFLFAFKDFWYPATDDRFVRQAEVERALPSIVEAYRAFIAKGGMPRTNETVIRLTSLSNPVGGVGPENRPIGTGTASTETIYAYLQKP